LGEEEHYVFNVLDDREIRANADDLGDGYSEARPLGEFPLNQMEVDYEEVDTRVIVGLVIGGRVVTGSFSESDIIDGLEGNGFEQDAEYSGYTVLRRERDTGSGVILEVVGVSGSTVVGGQSAPALGGPAARAVVETLIDTSGGATDRYVNENEDMARLVDELESGAFVFGRTLAPPRETDAANGQFAGQVAGGQVTSINGDTSQQTFTLLFASSDDIDTDDIETWTQASDDFDDIDDISISQSGRVVTVTGKTDTTNFFESE